MWRAVGNIEIMAKSIKEKQKVKFSLYRLLFRNNYSREGKKLQKGKVNLESYKDDLNLGDYLSLVICEYMLSLHSLTFSAASSDKKRIHHLMAVGSILGGRGDFDATVWGSGIRNFSSLKALGRKKLYQKLDIRAVRGPITSDALKQYGFSCPNVYGDPAILMPMIYQPKRVERRGTILISHYLTSKERYSEIDNITLLDIQTKDYEKFIDKVSSAEKVISSSLHGIILAESYGTPAIFLRQGIETETLKFYDWYYSTGRLNVAIASTIEEAIVMKPMPLPELTGMQKQLIETFPYDLWEGK